MNTPSEAVLHLITELFDGNRHTLVAKAREEERRERARARKEKDEEYQFMEVRSVYMTFNHLHIGAMVNTISGEITAPYAEGMVEHDGTLENVDVDLTPVPVVVDPAQLVLPLEAA